MGMYNDVYERLIRPDGQENEPLVGMVAYAIYKQSKVEYFSMMEKENTPITPEELLNYHKRITETILENLKTSARYVVMQSQEKFLDENRDRIVQEALGSMQAELQANIASSTRFGLGFKAGFWSSLAATAFIVILTMIGAYNYPGFIQTFLQAVAPTTIQAVSPPSPPNPAP